MKMNLAKLGEQAIENTTGSKNMRLSENATSMVFQLFTKNVYSNPIGTVVREITSNCFDSHIEAGVNKPVIIRYSEDGETNTKYISFIDFGVGMSPDRIENIYGVYFESTKRIDNTQIGGFGIGGKTPLAYKRSTGNGEGEYDNSFYVITIFDNIKYYYCIYEGESSPVISLLHQEETKEGNGTEVKIPVLQKDMYKFTNEMVRQLYYFENVVFENFKDNYDNEMFTNEYNIVRGDTFLFRGDDYSSNMHICLGRVAYPIDFSALELSSSNFNLPVGLRLEVGDINVTVSRESIDYSEETIKMLKKKLEEVKVEITSLLAKQYQEIKTLADYFEVKNNFGTLKFDNGMSMYVGNLIKQRDVDFTNFAYKVLSMPNDAQLFSLFFSVKRYGKKPNGRWNGTKEFVGSYKNLSNHTNVLYVNDEFNRKMIKQAYLKDEYETYYIVSQNNILTLDKWKVMDIFKDEDIKDLYNDKTGKPTAHAKRLIKMQKEYMSIVRDNTECYDTLEVPEEFIIERKNKRQMITAEMRKLTIPVKFVGAYSGRERVKLDKLFNYNMPIFWGTVEDEYVLSSAQNFYNTLFEEDSTVTSYSGYYGGFVTRGNNKPKNSIMFVQLAKGNVKYMEFCKNAMHISMFGAKMGYRKEETVKLFLQNKVIVKQSNEINDLFSKKAFELVNADWYKTSINVQEYIKSLPKVIQNDTLRYQDSVISKYINIPKEVKLTDEQELIKAEIEGLLMLGDMNENILNYLRIPYRLDSELEEHSQFIDILKSTMVL